MDQLNSVYTPLADIMESYSDGLAFTQAEQKIIDQRVADPKPQFSSSEDISKLFGKPFSA